MRLDTFKELAKSELHINWIVKGLLSPGGFSLLVGETKIGKSMLVVQLCESLQHGKPFLGFETKKHNCLYVQADAGLLEWQYQIKQLAGESYAWTAHQLEAGFLEDEREVQRLHEIVWGEYTVDVQGKHNYEAVQTVLQGKQFDFVVFDCLHKISSLDINLRSNVLKILEHLDKITSRISLVEVGQKVRERVHYLLIHHPNAQQKKGATAGEGNKSISALCSTKLSLSGTSMEAMLILEGSKVTPYQEVLLKRNVKGGWERYTVEVPQGFHNDFDNDGINTFDIDAVNKMLDERRR